MIGGFGYSPNSRTRACAPAFGRREAQNRAEKTALAVARAYFFSAGLSTGAPGAGGASTLISAG